jgi:hypothetical protein
MQGKSILFIWIGPNFKAGQVHLFICIGPNLEAGQIGFIHMYWSKFGSRARPFYSYGLVQIWKQGKSILFLWIGPNLMQVNTILFICIGPNLKARQDHFIHMYWSKFGSRASPFYSYGLVKIQ